MDIAQELREIQRMTNKPITLKRKLERIFAVFRYYSQIKNPESHDEINTISIAIILSRLECTGLRRRTNEFLDLYGQQLPEKAVEVLQNAFQVVEV